MVVICPSITTSAIQSLMKADFVMHLLQCSFDIPLQGLPLSLSLRTFPGTWIHVASLSHPPSFFSLSSRTWSTPLSFLSYVLGWNRPCLWFLFPFPLGRCERVPRIHTDEGRESGMGPRSPTNHPGTRSDGPRPGPRVRRGERRTVKRGRLFSTDGVRRTRECRVPSPPDRNRVRTRGILLSNPVVPGQRPSNRPSEEPPSPLHPSRTTLHPRFSPSFSHDSHEGVSAKGGGSAPAFSPRRPREADLHEETRNRTVREAKRM